MLASEPLLGENVWQALEFGELLAVDVSMRVQRVPPQPQHICMAL
jgi:predicted glutamine amidotransferase